AARAADGHADHPHLRGDRLRGRRGRLAGGRGVSWYYPKGWTDQEDGVEHVLIHYVSTPPGQWPDWSWGHESRVLEDRGGFPRTRLRVIRMPREVWDLEHGYNTPEYRFHYYFEVFQNGHRWTTDLFSEDIVYRD